MGNTITRKLILILAVLLVFVYGIVGIPRGGLKASLERRINLGLDLKGGTHLVLKVHTSEAVSSSNVTCLVTMIPPQR